MSEEETEETLTDPNQRIIKQITADDVISINNLFEMLMGQSIGPRKEYVKNHSKEATYEL